MRARAGLIALSVLTLAACGSTARNDRQQIRATLHTFATAQASGDGKKACAQLAPSGKNTLIVFVGHYTLPVRPTCEQALAQLPHLVGSQILRRFASATPRVVSISGDTAKAELVTRSSLGTVPVKLTRTRGAWKISAVPGLAGR
jgi:hypothetical protein